MTTLRTVVCIGLAISGLANAQQDELATGALQTVVAEAGQDPTPLEIILVTGEQPGPKLWKLSRGDHVMWVLGTHGPLPKKMSWRSNEVEAAIASSQEILTTGGFAPALDIGWYKIPFLMPSMFRAARNPDGARLQDVVPNDVYADWLRLKAAYLGKDDDVEKWRPAFAWEKLYGEAFDRSGLSHRDEIWPVIKKLARKHKVKITDTAHTEQIAIDKPRAALKEFSSAEVNDGDCFAQSVRNLEHSFVVMKRLANAWSSGDLEAYEATVRPDLVTGCQNAVFKAALESQFAERAGMEEFLELGMKAAHEKWLSAVETAIANNRSTFALLPMQELTSSAGRIAALKAKGYVVEAR